MSISDKPGCGDINLFNFLCQDSAVFVVLGNPDDNLSATDHNSGGKSGGV